MADLPNSRIPQLPPASTPQPTMLFPIYDPFDDTTKRIPAGNFMVSGTTGNFEWLTDTAYLEDAVVTRSGTWWQAQQDVPANIVPGTDPAYWLAIPKSASGFVFWAAGAFTEDEVFVLRALDSFIQIFRLINVTRPFVSANFEVEFAGGDWELMSERGYIGVSKAAHGFLLNDVLTWKTGAWNKYAVGDIPLALVRTVVNTELVIVVLIRQRLKGLTGLTPGAVYYAQNDGTVGTAVAGEAIFLAITATEAILF